MFSAEVGGRRLVATPGTGAGPTRDGARQAAVLVTAIAQVALPALLLPRVPRDVEPPDVLQPAPWTSPSGCPSTRRR